METYQAHGILTLEAARKRRAVGAQRLFFGALCAGRGFLRTYASERRGRWCPPWKQGSHLVLCLAVTFSDRPGWILLATRREEVGIR